MKLYFPLCTSSVIAPYKKDCNSIEFKKYISYNITIKKYYNNYKES